MSGPSESQIQIQVVHFLRHAVPAEVVWWHTPNGEIRDKRTAAKLKAMGVLPGVPDLVFILPGPKIVFIEMKSSTGRITPSQVEFERRTTALGVICHYVCRSVSDVETALREAGVKLKAGVSA